MDFGTWLQFDARKDLQSAHFIWTGYSFVNSEAKNYLHQTLELLPHV